MIAAGRLITAPSTAPGRGRHPQRQVQSEAQENTLEKATPAYGHRHRPHRVFENQVPADHPRDDLAQRRIGVGVCAPRNGDHRGELRVAQRRKRTGQAGGQIRKHNRRTGLVGRSGPGQDEDSGANDGADAEQGQVERRQTVRLKGDLPPCSTSLTSCSIDFVFSRFSYPFPLQPRRGRRRVRKSRHYSAALAALAASTKARVRAAGSPPVSRSVMTATLVAPAAITPPTRSSVSPPMATTSRPPAARVPHEVEPCGGISGVLGGCAEDRPDGDVAHRGRVPRRQSDWPNAWRRPPARPVPRLRAPRPVTDCPGPRERRRHRPTRPGLARSFSTPTTAARYGAASATIRRDSSSNSADARGLATDLHQRGAAAEHGRSQVYYRPAVRRGNPRIHDGIEPGKTQTASSKLLVRVPSGHLVAVHERGAEAPGLEVRIRRGI